MTDCGERDPHRVFRLIARIISAGAMLFLLALVWFAGQAPAVHASGVPWCPYPLPDEPAPTQTAIHLNRTEGPVGTDLTVTTHSWRPGAHVALHFDARNPKNGEMYTFIPDLAKGTVGRDGAITLSSFDVPSYFCVDMYSNDNTSYRFDSSGGTTAYFVLTSDHGEVSAPVAFRYLPAPTVTIHDVQWPIGATVGSSVTVTGSGWEAHEPLTLTLMTGDPTTLREQPYATRTHVTTDAHGNFLAGYPLDARLRWNINVWLVVEGSGSRFGALTELSDLFLSPAIQPTFAVDRTLVTPGMEITVSGEHWYPGDTFTIKFCNAHWQDGSWVDGPNCGKESNPALGTVTVGADGRIDQQFTMPDDGPPRTILVRVNEVTDAINVHPIPVQVVDHMPTWDDIHPRVAALRNGLVGSLPFTIPAALALGALAFVAIRRWRVRRSARAEGSTAPNDPEFGTPQ